MPRPSSSLHDLPRPADDAARGVDEAVVAAFLDAVFEVDRDDRTWTVRPLAAPVTAAGGTASFPVGVRAIAVVSARNAGGRPGDAAADAAAEAALRRALSALGADVTPAVGRSPDGGWREQSLAVPVADGGAASPAGAVDLPTLVGLARTHGQAALAVWTPGRLHTVWTPLSRPVSADTRPALATTSA